MRSVYVCTMYMFKILPPGQNAFKRERVADAYCSDWKVL